LALACFLPEPAIDIDEAVRASDLLQVTSKKRKDAEDFRDEPARAWRSRIKIAPPMQNSLPRPTEESWTSDSGV